MRRLLLVLVAGVTGPLRAQMNLQHPMHMHEGPLGIPEARMGSGTAWLPDASPMHAAHVVLGDWTLMLHGVGFLQYDRQGGSRGSNQMGLVNWEMAGATLHDRQHPHDLFMELAALYERRVAQSLGLSLYLAPVGEPAVGPVAFPHRPSAADDPLAPISHHWQDGTHITFGVVTAGVFTRNAKLEASWFNGREPDEIRTNLDYAGRRLDSYSARLTVNPGSRSRGWSGSRPAPGR